MFDIAGVIADTRHTASWKAKNAMESAKLEKYGISFLDVVKAYASGGFDDLFDDNLVSNPDKVRFSQTWARIQEYPCGDVKLYPEAVSVLNQLLQEGLEIAFVTRLTFENIANVVRELKARGFKGDVEPLDTPSQKGFEGALKVFYPKTDDDRRKDNRFVRYVLSRAIEDTTPPRFYVDDSVDRAHAMKRFDPSLMCIGSCRGFFGRAAFHEENRIRGLKVFDDTIDDLEELLKVIQSQQEEP